MEKSNFINVIVSIILVIAGICFLFYGILAGDGSGKDILLIILGVILIAYACLRAFLTNKAAKDLT